jgi:hypothetical protein
MSAQNPWGPSCARQRTWGSPYARRVFRHSATEGGVQSILGWHALIDNRIRLDESFNVALAKEDKITPLSLIDLSDFRLW